MFTPVADKDVTPEDKDILESVLSTFMAVFESKEAMEVQHDVLTKVIIVLQVLKTRAYLQPANSRQVLLSCWSNPVLSIA